MHCIAAMVVAASGDGSGARRIVDHLHRSGQTCKREKLVRAPYDMGAEVRTILQGAANALGLSPPPGKAVPARHLKYCRRMPPPDKHHSGQASADAG